MNTNRIIGISLTVVGFVIAVLAGLWIASQTSTNALTPGGALIGAGLAFLIIAPLVGFGLYFFIRSGAEEKEVSAMRQQRQLLDIVKSRGKVSVSEVAVELGVPVSSVKSMVHQLVGLEVFSGYVNWNEDTLYSEEANSLRALDKCKNCGGEITLAGKGIIQCPYCGTEYFLS